MLTGETEFANGFRRAARTFDAAGRLAEACEFSPTARATARSSGAFPPRPKAPTPTRASARSAARSIADRQWGPGRSSTRRRRAEDSRCAAWRSPGSEATSPAFAPGAGNGARDGRRLVGAGSRAAGGGARARGALRGGAAAARDGDRAALARALAADVVPLAPALAAQRGEALEQSVEAKVCVRSSTPSCVAPTPPRRSGRWPRCCRGPAPRRRTSWRRRSSWRPSGGSPISRGRSSGSSTATSRGRAPIPRSSPPNRPSAAALADRHSSRRSAPVHFLARAASSSCPIPSLGRPGAGLVRDLDEVRATIAVYATRIGRVRARPSGHSSVRT